MRVEPEFKSLPSSLAEYTLHFWSTVDGPVDVKNKAIVGANDPLEVLSLLRGLVAKNVYFRAGF